MTSQILTRFIHALWLGSGVFLIVVAAPAAFRAAPNATAAADVVGAMLSKWHYLALAAPLALLFLDWKRARVSVLVIVFIAILMAALQVMVDLRIRSIRARSIVPISELSRTDPVRKQFGLLHGLSSLLLLGQVFAAATALAVDKEAYAPRRVSRVVTPPVPHGSQEPSRIAPVSSANTPDASPEAGASGATGVPPVES
jgi:hypothetical protein